MLCSWRSAAFEGRVAGNGCNTGLKHLDDLAKPRAMPAESGDVPSDAPGWVNGADPRTAFLHGFAIIREVPAIILGATGAGFGALAHDAGLAFGPVVFMSFVFYATPAQVVLIDQLARGASLLAAAFAIALTAVRLLPMTVSLMPLLRSPDVPRWQYVWAAHYIAVTCWTEAFRRLPRLPPRLRMGHFLGLGTGLVTSLMIGTAIGYALAGVVPPVLTSALLFMTPLYFMMSLVQGARQTTDWTAIAAGLLLGPMLFIAAPGFDLLLSGLIGGTIAFLVGEGRRGVPS